MQFPAGIAAKRAGHYLCVADKELYNMIDLNTASSFQLLPISQAGDGKVVRPSITVINENEFLLLSWTGQATMGVFLTGDGNPVRGTLEWAEYPESISERNRLIAPHQCIHDFAALDYPFVTAILPSQTVEIHNIETQSLVQSIPAPPSSPTLASPIPTDRKRVVWCGGGFMVPSDQRAGKLKMVSVPLTRKKKTQEPMEAAQEEPQEGVQEGGYNVESPAEPAEQLAAETAPEQ